MAEPPPGLLVIGDIVTDVVARHRVPDRPGLVAAGEARAAVSVRPGGSAANTAAWAAFLGAETRLLARAGADSAEWHAGELAAAGVRPYLRVDPVHPTAVVIAMVDATGERSMLTDRGAGGRLGPADWDRSLLDGVGVLHVSGYTLFTGEGLALVRTATAEAAARGIRVSVDPASEAFLREFGADRFVRETAGAALVLPNRDEALLLAGCDDVVAAARRLSSRYGTAAVKLGARGALLARDGEVAARVPAVPADPVDSTGAGDAFAAGYLTAWMAGAADHDALSAGCRAGAEAVTRVGGRPRIRHSPDSVANELYPIDTN